MDFLNEKDIKKLILAQEKEIEAYVLSIKSELDRFISDVAKGIKPSSSIVNVAGQLDRLRTANLPNALKNKLNEIVSLYQARLDIVSEMFEQVNGLNKIFNEPDVLAINTIIETDKARILTTFDETFNEFKTVVKKGVITNTLPDVNELKTRLGDKTKEKLETETRTQLGGFQRSVQLKKAEDLGLNYFYYAGNLIPTSRAFCIQRAGKIYTVAEAKTWDNGQGLPAIPYLGGWNCRHTMVFMSEEKAREQGFNG